MDCERSEAGFSRVDPRTHQLERLGNAVDWSAPNRVVTVEFETRSVLPREPAREKADQSASVADIYRSFRDGSIAKPNAPDHHPIGTPFDQRSELLNCSERRERVGRFQIVRYQYRLVCHRGQDRGAM